MYRQLTFETETHDVIVDYQLVWVESYCNTDRGRQDLSDYELSVKKCSDMKWLVTNMPRFLEQVDRAWRDEGCPRNDEE